MNLRATHYGYTYQDLMTAIALVDLLLGNVQSVTVDVKGFEGDRFDDLTIEQHSGRRLRVQIKHTTHDRELAKSSFSGAGRSLKLDDLLKAVLKDLQDHPETKYRVLVRDGAPDSELAEVLKPAFELPEVSEPIPGIVTRPFQFEPRSLRQREPWRSLVSAIEEADLESACRALIVDTQAPASSINLTDPGSAEVALLRRVTEELGAGRPPNSHRAPEDVALALIHAATAARTLEGNVRRAGLSPRIGLTTDFGAVVAGYPVERSFVVARDDLRGTISERLIQTAIEGGRTVLSGEPGSGKSWLCEQLSDSFREADWIVARHHCWLGASDLDRLERVSADVVIGSWLSQIEEQAPEAVAAVRPRFAATVETLEAALAACREIYPDRSVLLIVDGLDHADRVLGRSTLSVPDPSRALVDRLAGVALPAGVAMLIASQPGPHLENAHPPTDEWSGMPRMSLPEVARLARRYRLVANGALEQPQATDDERAIVDALFERSGGNPLYATYLCRLALGSSSLSAHLPVPPTSREMKNRLLNVPPSATDIDGYYDHLLAGLTDGQQIAIGALAICDFAVSPSELTEMVPEVAFLIDAALSALAPVLNSQPGLGGLKVHHESFSRYIVHDKPDSWVSTIREKAVAWLQQRGFLADARAFRHIPSLLAALDRYDELSELVHDGFVGQAIAALQPPEALRRVVSILATCSEGRLDWPTLVRCIELRKAIAVYENDSLPDTLVNYGDVVVSVLGAERVAERLLYEGRTTFPSRWGLQLCRLVDEAGASAPWRQYLQAHDREAQAERVSYSAGDNRRLALSRQLGSLRVREQDDGLDDDFTERVAVHLTGMPIADLGSLTEVFNRGLPSGSMIEVASKISDEAKASAVYVALGDLSFSGEAGLPSPLELAREAHRLDPDGDVMAFLRLGVSPAEVLAGLPIASLDAGLAASSQTITTNQHADYEQIAAWMWKLSLAQSIDQSLVLAQSSYLSGVGFYRAWLRFVVATVGLREDLDAGSIELQQASTAARLALSELAAHAKPFTGSPRACDLYSVHTLIHQTFERALAVLVPDDLPTVLEDLLRIGNGTTTSLMGMPGSGPLTTNDLLGLLARLSGPLGVDHVHELIERIRDNEDATNGNYSILADFELAAARICVQAGAYDEARVCWERAATLLAAYGGHKDPTILEFLDSIEDLHTVDSLKASEALAELLDPVYLVRQHTDGRSTSHVARRWWEILARIDPVAAALDGAEVWLAELGLEDARVQTALEELLENRGADVDPIVAAALRMAVGSDWRQPEIDLQLLRRLRPAYGRDIEVDVLLASIASNIAASYDDQPLVASSDATTSAATAALIEAVVDIGGSSFEIRMAPQEPVTESQTDGRRRPAEPMRLIESRQRPTLPDGPMGALAAAREYNSKSYDDDADSPRWSFDGVVGAIGWRLLEVIDSAGEEAGIELLDAIGQEISAYGENTLFAALGEGLAMRVPGSTIPLERVTAHCLAMAYTRIRGGGGWQSFAGREYSHLWKRAYQLSPNTAEKTLAAAVLRIVLDESSNLYGVTQGVVAALAALPAQDQDGTALDTWRAAFGVLRTRLPGIAERSHHSYTPRPGAPEHENLDEALATLAIASVSQAVRADLRRALLAVALLVTCRPEMAQVALARVLSHPLDAARQTWLLEVLEECLGEVPLTEAMAATLTLLCQQDRLSVRVRAREILAAYGKPLPEHRVSEPAARVRQAFGRIADTQR